MILGWIVIDRITGEWCLRCGSRKEARAFARTCEGLVASVRVEH